MKIKEYLRFIMRVGIVLPSLAILLIVAVSVRGKEQWFQNNKRSMDMEEGIFHYPKVIISRISFCNFKMQTTSMAYHFSSFRNPDSG